VADNENDATQPPGDLTPEEAQRIDDELRAMATNALRSAREAIGVLGDLPQMSGAIGEALASRFEAFELALRGSVTELEERMPGGPIELPDA
jgi:hypothetical protein